MDEKKLFEEKINRTLQAMEHPEQFTEEELRVLLADEEKLQVCRDLLDSKEALARRYAPTPKIEGEWRKFSARHSSPKVIRCTIALVAAASIALFFLLRTTYEPSGYTVFEATAAVQEITINTRQGMNVLTVPRGMNKKITLADGTQVWLNAESRLEYPETFEGQERRVVHLKGEAYFEVAKDAAHPFIVETDLLKTQVVGTAFNVRAYSPEDAQVTLVEGSLKVSDVRNKKGILMKPGQNATLRKEGNFTVNAVEAKAHSSWAEGQFYFDNMELVEIMRELGRWYNINIIFTSKEAMHYRLHFQSDRSEPLPQVLDLLNCMQKVKAKLKNNEVIISL